MAKEKIWKVGPEARDKVFAGMEKLSSPLRIAVGPYGFNMMSGVKGGAPLISNDAKEIADNIKLDDELEDLGMRHMRDAISRANDLAGNGRKTCAILTESIAKEIIRLLPTAKISVGRRPIKEVLEAVDIEANLCVEALTKLSVPVTTKEQLIEVAITASENKQIGTLIAETQWELGKYGTIIAEESNSGKISVERVNGIRIDNGFGTSIMVNNLERYALEVSEAKILLTNYVIQDLDVIKKLIDALWMAGTRQLIIVARAFSPEAIKASQEYHKRGYQIWPINAPFTNQGQMMRDIGATTGATYIDNEARDLGDILVSDVGFVKRMEASRWTTVFTGPDNSEIKKKVEARIIDLEKELKGEQSVFAKRALESRISQLKSGFAIIKIGSLSAGNQKYKQDKADDAIRTTKGALEEGTVPGAGKAHVAIAETLPEDSIIKNALKAPYEQIMANAGKVIDVPDSIKDSTKVVRIGLIHAIELASAVATIGIAVNDKKEKPRFVQEASQPEEEGVE